MHLVGFIIRLCDMTLYTITGATKPHNVCCIFAYQNVSLRQLEEYLKYTVTFVAI